MHRDDDSPPFTFVRVCQLFNLDPDWIRSMVRRRLRRGRPARAQSLERAA